MTENPTQFANLVSRLSQLNARQLDAVEAIFAGMEQLCHRSAAAGQSNSQTPHVSNASLSIDWPRAPIHRLNGKGAFLVTGGTHHKRHHFQDAESLDYLEMELLKKAKQYDWQLEAWAVFSNHYHFVGQACSDAESLGPMLNHLHSDTARWINERNVIVDRRVWYNFWETELTYPKSYQARLHYVHRNAVHHGLVRVPNQYRWCSAAWFERTATPAQVATICSFKTDKITVIDDFEPVVA